MKKDEFIKQMIKLGAMEDQSCSPIERKIIIKEAERLYDKHLIETSKAFTNVIPTFEPSNDDISKACESYYEQTYLPEHDEEWKAWEISLEIVRFKKILSILKAQH